MKLEKDEYPTQVHHDLELKNALVLIPLGNPPAEMLVERVPPEFALRFPSNVTGKPVREVFAELGPVLDTVAREAFSSHKPGQIITVHYDKPQDPLHGIRIRARSVTNYYYSQTMTRKHGIGPTGPALFLWISLPKSLSAFGDSSYRSAAFHGLIGASSVMQALFHRISMYGPSEAPVIITGETGTGKELAARALHATSARRTKPFVAVNCTALNEELFESELFGHERGSFTGAVRAHKGRFERADTGTLFLDEIGDMPVRTQAKLLRVLEEKKVERIGGEREIPVDVRIIAATNISLEHAVGAGRFRADLYHRLAVLRIHVPPLRDRTEDIPLLVSYFLDNLNRRYQKQIRKLTPDAVKLLQSYHWPGNIRELRNVLERVYVEAQGPVIGRNAFREWEKERDYLAAGQWDLNHFDTQRLSRSPIISVPGSSSQRDIDPLGESAQTLWYMFLDRLKTAPRALPPVSVLDGEYQVAGTRHADGPREITPDQLKTAYREAGGNISRAARLLNIHKATFYRYMKKYRLSRDDL